MSALNISFNDFKENEKSVKNKTARRIIRLLLNWSPIVFD